MPDLIITPDVVELGARAMYTASLANAIPAGNRRLRAWLTTGRNHD